MIAVMEGRMVSKYLSATASSTYKKFEGGSHVGITNHVPHLVVPCKEFWVSYISKGNSLRPF